MRKSQRLISKILQLTKQPIYYLQWKQLKIYLTSLYTLGQTPIRPTERLLNTIRKE